MTAPLGSSRQTEMLVRELGQEETLTEFTQNGTDDAGDPKWDETETTVWLARSFVTNTTAPRRQKSGRGEARVGDYELYGLDSELSHLTTPSTGRLPEATFDENTYRVLDTETPGIGATRLIVEKKR